MNHGANKNPKSRRIEMLNPKIELQIAAQQTENLSKQLQAESCLLSTSKTIQNAYSPAAWIRHFMIQRSVIRGMAINRMVAAGKTMAEIQAETNCTTSEIAAYKAWNTMYAKSFGLSIQPPKPGKNGKVSKKRQTKNEADMAFLKSCGIQVEEEEAV